MNTKKLIAQQNTFFNSNQTKDINFRIEQLQKLKQILKTKESDICQAIHADFGKSEFESYLTELSLLYHEIDFFIKKIKSFSKPKKVRTNLVNLPAKSYIISEPLGTTLILGAWNYPLQLSLLPALTSLAAGNTVIVKPSELAPNTSAIIAKLINENFPVEYFYVYEGGVAETTELLSYRFDKIFFTGSTAIGKIVYQAAAKHLTPVTLELGGKSPTFVFSDCDLEVTAKRIVWAKFLNAGQTCIAPDYIVVEKSIEEKFHQAVQAEIQKRYSDSSDKAIGSNYLQIINEKNFDRLSNLIDTDKIYCGGNTNRETRFISPTLLRNINFTNSIMQEEIFGPILPTIGFDNLDSVIAEIKTGEKPLACYIYTKNKIIIKKLLSELSFGGGAINDSLMHLSNGNLPFGGVGFSGIGNYHGKAGFDCFSHQKSILQKPFWGETPLKYAPYTPIKQKILRWFMG